MFTSRRVELNPAEQKTLEALYLRKIREINAKIKQFNLTYNNFESADERIKQRYSKEEYKKQFIDWAFEERSDYIHKLSRVRKGYTIE